MDSRKRKQREEESDSDSESESEPSDESEESLPAEKEKKKKETKTTPKETPQKKKKVVVEDSPPEEDQYFDGETYEISSDELDEWLGENVNKFTGYVFSRLIAYAGGKPLEKGEKEKEIKAPYVKISGQKTSYDCAIYVMKWLELIEPENIKKGKYEWDNWTQEEVDHYRVEYASRILFSELNRQRDQAIRESSAIRLSKPSSVLLSPFCQINSEDIETG
ncbi:uncharacterized protein LOC130942253 [Arachis stenosperma]|uniref:uncharacterized protein LOC130942253 n=1 Tax=Arachis stenosperma TaxID=217475 RepID=UPI0025AD5358|nr:uncharacterized protein LOC130942253 [Arachis stenosperma]